MKRILLVGALALATSLPALAADLPPAPPPPPRAPAAYVPVAPVFSWTGVYLGINGGYGFGSTQWNTSFGTVGSFSTSGGMAGGTIGANYQLGQFVFGFEGDVDWQNLRGATVNQPCTSVVIAVIPIGVGGCATASNWIATARARAGIAMDHALLYATFGGAFTNIKPSTGALPYGGGTEPGWAAGGGIEYAVTDNWTVKAEYLYADFERTTCNAGSCGILGAVAAPVRLTESMARGGINYKFGF
jgi:outer membrane immunogenic protein